MEYEQGQEMPEIQEFLHRHRMTSHGRRKTVHVAERGRTALGLVRLPPSPIRKTYLTKRASLTPTPAVKVSFHVEQSRFVRPGSSYVRTLQPPTSPRLVKYKSDQSYLHHGGMDKNIHQAGGDKKQLLHAPFYQRRGSLLHTRRRSTITSDTTEEDEYKKV